MAETNPSPSVFEYMMPHFVSCPYCGEKMHDSPQTVYTASYNIKELLDTKLIMKWGRALTLRDLVEDHAFDARPDEMTDEYTLKTTVDGQHIDVAFVK